MTVRTLLQRLKLTGVAGVDSPAHLMPGWVVMKSADDLDVVSAIDEALQPARTALAEERAELHEIRQLLERNDEELRRIQVGDVQKSTRDLRDQVDEQSERLERLTAWVGTDVSQSVEKAKRLTATEASRLFWGLDQQGDER